MAHIIIDKDDLCTCRCFDKCILNKTGMGPRCTKSQIEECNHVPVKLKKGWLGWYKLIVERPINNL